MKKPTLTLAATLFLLSAALPASAQTETAHPASITPVDRADGPAWWMPRHLEKKSEAEKHGPNIRLLFIGDSITHQWDDAVWAEHFAKYNALNLGFGGDRTEHVLWRLQNGALDHLSPEVTVIMIGTNNTGQGEGQPPADTLLGIEAIIKEVQARLPDTQIILHTIFPRGPDSQDPKRLINDKINQGLPKLAEKTGARLLDINHLFLEKDGTLSGTVMPDALHPKRYGYQIWAEGLAPVLAEHLEPARKASPAPVHVLWPEGVPAPHDATLVETSNLRGRDINLSDISTPSLSLYLTKSNRPSGLVIVCPGGGYNSLSWTKEGEEAARWLNSIGFSAAILKYRTNQNREGALQDAQRALGIARQHAKEWNIIPQRIGMLGFSAGGHLTAAASTQWQSRTYAPIDEADTFSCRPDFAVLVYPAYLGDKNLELVDSITVTPDTPPTFIVQTQDDQKYVASAFAYSRALHQAGVLCEFHLFPTGRHGYGLRPSAYPVSQWENLCRDWLLRR